MTSMTRRSRSLFVIVLCAVGGALAADENDQRRVGSDVFISGGTVTVDDAVGGDLFAAGGTVDVDAAVAGDAVAAGGKLRLGAEVGQSVYAAGGQVNINAKVGRNLRVAGGRVELGPKADVAGNVSMAGGQLRLTARSGGTCRPQADACTSTGRSAATCWRCLARSNWDRRPALPASCVIAVARRYGRTPGRK